MELIARADLELGEELAQVVLGYACLADIDFAHARRSLDEHLLPALRVARDEPAECHPEGRCRS